MEPEKQKTKKQPKKRSGLKLFGKIILGIFIVLILVVLFIRSPWGQNIIVDRLISYISNKTQTIIEVDRIFISFSGDINMEGLYLEDQQGDTLIYSELLEADISLMPLIKREKFSLNSLKWEGVRANITRTDSIEGFNYQFLLDAFVKKDTSEVISTNDSISPPMELSLGDLQFSDVTLNYKDLAGGVESTIRLGDMNVEIDEFDMDNMEFNISKAHLKDSRITFKQRKTFPKSQENEQAPLPKISFGELSLNRVEGHYHSIPQNLLAATSIDELILELPEANLQENKVIIERFRLQNSAVMVHASRSLETPIRKNDSIDDMPVFEWPQWNVLAKEISLANNIFQFTEGNAAVKKGVFNPQALEFKDVSFNANHLAYEPGNAEAYVQKLHFRESSGMNLHQFSIDLEVTDNSLSFRKLNTQLNKNSLSGDGKLSYSGMINFLENPEQAKMQLQLPQFKIDLNDVFQFQPKLRENEYLNALSEKLLYGNLYASGRLSEMSIRNTRVNWGNNTELTLQGKVFNATVPENLNYNFQKFKLASNRNDLLKIVKEDELGIRIPETLEIAGNITGTSKRIQTNATLNSTAGQIKLNGYFDSSPGIAFNANLEVIDLKTGELFQNESLGPLSLNLTATGSGSNINTLDATMETTISSLGYKNYTLKDLKISGVLKNGRGNMGLKYKDESLNMTADGFIELDSIAPRIALQLDVIGANLEDLGVFDRSVRTAFKMEAEFEGNTTKYDLSAKVFDGVAVYDNETYLLGNLSVNGHVEEDTTSLDIHNRMLNLRLRSNASPLDFSNALNRHYESYFSDVSHTDTVQRPVKLEFSAQVSPTPLLEEVLLPKLEGLDTIQVTIDFQEKERSLLADINLPLIRYFGSSIDSLQFHLNSNKNKLDFDFGLKSFDYGPLAIKETILKGELQNKNLLLDFTSIHNEKRLLHIQSQVSKKEDVLRIHVIPEDLLLNSVAWNMNPENEVLIKKDSWTFHDFRLSNDQQEMVISHQIPGVQKEHLGLEFQNFNLATLFSYLNPEQVLASGNLNGQFIVEEPFGSTGLLADLRIDDFAVRKVPFGVLTLEGEAIGRKTYDFKLAIKEGDVDLDLNGSYLANETAANLNFDLAINEVKMKVIEGLSLEELHSASGSFSGNFFVKGTTQEPVYEGSLNFNQAAFTVATLNAPFLLENESLLINNEGLFMEDFKIKDGKRNQLTIAGSILTEDFTNPEFDLRLNARNFTALNSTEEDNELFYGIAVFDVNGTITGNLELPKIDADLDIKNETNMTYVIPSARLKIEEREGVVVFVNRENPDRILTQKTASEDAVTFSGVNLNSYISLEKNATFTVVLNEDTGDHFKASGEGDLLFNVYPNGRTTLSGRVDINDGYYEMSLYNLVTRKFDLLDGSNIVWAGDPLDADLDIKAVYKVEASASGLMAPQITGIGVEEKQKYRQELSFLVYLNIGGDISQPILSFGLDMPEDEKGAIGGQVYGRVQQVNTQENELNKQVFSLLVLNRFFPDSGSDGSGGGTLAFARDNLNEAISDQLNLFSDKLFGETGIDLKFGLDSYTDYQGESPQERTQLDITAQKSLLNDRLVVSVGSEVDLQGSSQVEEESTVIGNVSLEYLLTEDGRFRLRAFRRKSYENVIDGQLIVSGLSLIFTQEFNRFHEIWDQVVKDEKKKAEKDN